MCVFSVKMNFDILRWLCIIAIFDILFICFKFSKWIWRRSITSETRLSSSIFGNVNSKSQYQCLFIWHRNSTHINEMTRLFELLAIFHYHQIDVINMHFQRKYFYLNILQIAFGLFMIYPIFAWNYT